MATEGKQWKRVTGPNLDTLAEAGYLARQATLQSGIFQKACELAGIEATKRQARKWLHGKGKACLYKQEAHAAVAQ